MVSFIFFGVLLLCVVCFACISTNMVFYIISYDTTPRAGWSLGLSTVQSCEEFSFAVGFWMWISCHMTQQKNDDLSYVP